VSSFAKTKEDSSWHEKQISIKTSNLELDESKSVYQNLSKSKGCDGFKFQIVKYPSSNCFQVVTSKTPQNNFQKQNNFQQYFSNQNFQKILLREHGFYRNNPRIFCQKYFPSKLAFQSLRYKHVLKLLWKYIEIGPVKIKHNTQKGHSNFVTHSFLRVNKSIPNFFYQNNTKLKSHPTFNCWDHEQA